LCAGVRNRDYGSQNLHKAEKSVSKTATKREANECGARRVSGRCGFPRSRLQPRKLANLRGGGGSFTKFEACAKKSSCLKERRQSQDQIFVPLLESFVPSCIVPERELSLSLSFSLSLSPASLFSFVPYFGDSSEHITCQRDQYCR
jgi:hypothetical protein